MIIFDTHILSMFAKVDAINLLKHLFGEKILITPKIRDEISTPLEYGYTFPLKVISTIPQPLDALTQRLYDGFYRKQDSLKRGDEDE